MLKLYLLEIRNRIGLIILSWLLVFFVCYWYKETLLFLFIKPFIRLYSGASYTSYFIATNLTEIFSSYMLISFFIVNQLVLFFAISQVLFFFSPALYKSEYIKIKKLCLFSFLLWLLNILFLNNFVFSYVFTFFLSFQDQVNNSTTSVHFEIRIIEYLTFYKKLFCFSAFIFQTFLFIFLFLNKLNNKEIFLKNYRKLFFFFFFFVATIISPPDVFSQLFLGFGFILLFELLIVISLWLSNLSRNRL